MEIEDEQQVIQDNGDWKIKGNRPSTRYADFLMTLHSPERLSKDIRMSIRGTICMSNPS
jgi:hypothetical protein